MKRVVVAGGGIVGAHVALFFAENGCEVYLIEKNSSLGRETSTRNSGVLHAGIYYRNDSLKARLCVSGNALSREFCELHGISCRKTGKFIVARDDAEDQELDRLRDNAKQNGVPEIEFVSGRSMRERAGFVRCSRALYSGTTSIVDAGEYVSTLKVLLYQSGVHMIFSCAVRGFSGNGRVETDRGEMEADIAVNAAGLYADEIAEASGLPDYRIIPLKGDYYCTAGFALPLPVYPVPDNAHGTLGVHLTPTMGKEVLIGPSHVPSSGKDDYRIETPREAFEDSLRKMIDGDLFRRISLYEGFSGNRPRAYLNGNPCEDFVIAKQGNSIHLLGIESPGLTAAPAIARHVYGMV